jgi:hypothetical protein
LSKTQIAVVHQMGFLGPAEGCIQDICDYIKMSAMVRNLLFISLQ